MYKPNPLYDRSSKDTSCLETIGVLIMVVVMPVAGPLAAIFTYQLVIGATEPTSELLRYIVICWVAYLLCVWIFIKTDNENHWNHPHTNRFILFLIVAIGWLGVVVGGIGTLIFGAQIFFPGPGSEISQANVRDGLLAIAFLTAGILLFRILSEDPEDYEHEPEDYEQYPENYEQYPEDWEDIRRAVLKRDDYCCANCRSTENLHVHHIVPLSVGGSNEQSNLKTLCKGCHTRLHPHMRD